MPYKPWRVLSEVISHNGEFCKLSLLQMSFMLDLLGLFDIKDAFHVLFSLDRTFFFCAIVCRNNLIYRTFDFHVVVYSSSLNFLVQPTILCSGLRNVLIPKATNFSC